MFPLSLYLTDLNDPDLLSKLRRQNSPVVDQPECVRFEKWVKEQSVPHDAVDPIPAPAVSRRLAPLSLEQILRSPSPAGAGAVPTDRQLAAGASLNPHFGRSHAEQRGELLANATSDVLDGKHEIHPASGFLTNSNLFSITAIIHIIYHWQRSSYVGPEESRYTNVQVDCIGCCLDHNMGVGSFITFTISQEVARRLATCQSDMLQDAVPISRPASLIEINRTEVYAALDCLSFSCLNIPSHPNLPFVTLWMGLQYQSPSKNTMHLNSTLRIGAMKLLPVLTNTWLAILVSECPACLPERLTICQTRPFYPLSPPNPDHKLHRSIGQ